MSIYHFCKRCIICYKWTFKLALKIVNAHPRITSDRYACWWLERTLLGEACPLHTGNTWGTY